LQRGVGGDFERLPLGREPFSSEPFDASALLSIDPELRRRVDELRVSSRVEKLQAERLRGVYPEEFEGLAMTAHIFAPNYAIFYRAL
jgi:hypothetical protein